MKKLFIALSLLAVLGFSLTPALANVPGARDISPGTAFKSYFMVSKARVDSGSGPSTLFQISETKGTVGLSPLLTVIWSRLHFNVYDVNSKWIFDFKVPITRWQSILMDFGKILYDYQEVIDQLLVDFDGADYYAGYVIVEEDMFGTRDNILADVIQCDLSSGIAAGANIPMKAYVGTDGTICEGINALATEWWQDAVYDWALSPYEVFSGAAMASAQELAWGRPCPDINQFYNDEAGEGWFAMYPRYLINDANANTYWIILRSSLYDWAYTGELVEYVPFHTWVINKAEDWRSVTIDIREMSILSAKKVVPTALKLSYPYVGLVNLKIPGDYNSGTGWSVPERSTMLMELLGWNWKVARSGSGSLNWGAMTLMAADAGTVGDGTQPNY